MYPNTEASPSLLMFSFKTNKEIPANSYILITMSWYATDVSPHTCIFLNHTNTGIQCTNLKTPSADVPITITSAIMQSHNSLLADDKTLVLDLASNTLTKDTEYKLQITLYNPVSNIQKISPSIEIYIVSGTGLVYEENLNYGPVINKPTFTNLLATSILNDLTTNEPGTFSSLLA